MINAISTEKQNIEIKINKAVESNAMMQHQKIVAW